MNRSKLTQEVLEKRIMLYSLTASAVVAATGSISGQVVKQDIGVTLNTNGTFYDVDFNGTIFRINYYKSDFVSTSGHTYIAGHYHTYTVHSTISGVTYTFTSKKWISGYTMGGSTWNVKSRLAQFDGSGDKKIIGTYLNSGSLIDSGRSFVSNQQLAKYFDNPHGGHDQGGPFLGRSNKFIGVKFTNLGTTHYGWIKISVDTDASSVYIISAAYEQISDQAIQAGSDVSLPIELSAFSAVPTEGVVKLIWETATEVSNYGFNIERRINSFKFDGNNAWQKIGFVDGNGTSNSPKQYSFIDDTPNLNGKYSYRLKQIDYDGTYTYSKTAEVECIVIPASFELKQNFPNPFNPATTIKYSLPGTEKVKLTVYDVLGKEVAVLVDEEKSAGTYEVKFDGSNLPSGIYLYKIVAGGFTASKKLMIIK